MGFDGEEKTDLGENGLECSARDAQQEGSGPGLAAHSSLLQRNWHWHSLQAPRGAPSGAARACGIPYSACVSGNAALRWMGDGATTEAGFLIGREWT